MAQPVSTPSPAERAPQLAELSRLYQQMLTIRRLEEACAKAYSTGKIGGFLHLGIGQEAVCVGSIAATRPEDYVVATYREHGHCYAKGGSARAILAELYGKKTGISRGLGGSMHLFDAEHNFLGGYGIVGGHVPLAAGVAFRNKYLGEKRVTLCFFGEGSASMGPFHEGMALAALWKLPIVFICENNLYSMGTPLYRSLSIEDVSMKALAYGMARDRFDGNDVTLVQGRVAEAVERARETNEPTLIEVRTYRFRGHSMSDPGKYRTREEVEEWQKRDPVSLARQRLTEELAAREEDIKTIEAKVRAEIEDAVKFAEDSAPADRYADLTYVEDGERQLMATMLYREALNAAMCEEMARDPSIFLMGEEVGEYQGAYKVSAGMLQKFGAKRVVDTPIVETGFAGIGIGAAMTGLRPIIEFMTFNFSLVAIDQIINNAAKIRQMSGGQFKVPIVFRGAGGAAGQLAAQHSQSLESYYVHCPGLKVVMPSTPKDAKGLLKTAIRDDNPVIFIESELLYGTSGEVPDGEYLIPLGVADVKRAGSDVTLVAYSKMVHTCLTAADALAEQGISAEVVDVRSLRPLDLPAIVASIAKTHRCVVVQEGWPMAGMAAELAFQIQDAAFDLLDAPIGRVTNQDVPTPYAKNLEALVAPSPEKVIAAVRKVLYLDAPGEER